MSVFSGARSVFYVNNVKVAYAFGCEVQEEIQHEEIQTLDMLSVMEHVPVAYRVSLSAEIFKTISGFSGNSATPGSTGVSTVAGDISGSLKDKGVFPSTGLGDASILTFPVMTAIVKDNQKGGTMSDIATLSNVRPTSKNFSIRARQIVGENVRFVAQRAKDEKNL